MKNSITLIRKAKQLKQADLAKRAGISPEYLSKIERGKQNCSINVLNNIATALEVPISRLFEGVKIGDGSSGK